MGGLTGYSGKPQAAPARQNAERPTYSYCRYVTYRDGDAVECGAEKPKNFSPYCPECREKTAPLSAKYTQHHTATSVSFNGSRA